MKYLATLCVAALVAGVNSAAIAAPEPEAYCWRPGQPCGKVKRAAEAFAEAIAEPAADAKASPYCWRPGQPCGKAKRTALALAHAVADAHPEAKAFFDMLAIREAFPEPEAVAEAEAGNDKVKREAEAEAEAYCWRPGQPCGKVKRAAEAIASALAEPAPGPYCWRPGQPCGKAKRDAEATAEAYCWRPGQPCGKAKREANALAEAAAEAIASLNATSASSSTSAEIRRSFASVQSDIFKPTKYGSKYTVTLIPGDGIGAEITESVKTVFKADNVPIEWEQVDVSGLESGAKHSEELFRESIASLKRNKIGLKGILHTPVDRSGHQSFNVALRQELDIYASVVLIKNIPGYETRHKNVDFAIIRENTEGEYSGLEHQSVPGVVESLKIITRAKSERIAKFAFSFALANNRKKVTCIHKANIMKLADGLFRNTFNAVAKEFPTLESSDMIVDNASMQCVSRPQQFDVMVMPNLYGGILSNVGAALVGGPGIVPGCNMGRDVAVFEPGCRHVGLDIKGKDQANPTAMLLSGAMMLRHLGLDEHANRISKAVYDVIAAGQVRTRDMGGNSTTNEFTRAVLDKM
ncbi:isocitrate dehydrogenase (NAD(+)) idh1 [Pseudogymnoascus australis]